MNGDWVKNLKAKVILRLLKRYLEKCLKDSEVKIPSTPLQTLELTNKFNPRFFSL